MVSLCYQNLPNSQSQSFFPIKNEFSCFSQCLAHKKESDNEIMVTLEKRKIQKINQSILLLTTPKIFLNFISLPSVSVSGEELDDA